MRNEIHHPITNGKTKMMIFSSLIFLFIIAILSLTFTFTSIHTADMSIGGWWVLKGILGATAIHSIAGIIYAVKSFFDTREATQKHADRLAILKEKNFYKLERFKLKQAAKKIKIA